MQSASRGFGPASLKLKHFTQFSTPLCYPTCDHALQREAQPQIHPHGWAIWEDDVDVDGWSTRRWRGSQQILPTEPTYPRRDGQIPPPRSQSPSAAAAGAGIGVCVCVGVAVPVVNGSRYGPGTAAPQIAPRWGSSRPLPLPGSAIGYQSNPPDRTQKMISPSSLPDLITSPPIRSAQLKKRRPGGWVSLLTLTRTPGQERALGVELLHFLGAVFPIRS